MLVAPFQLRDRLQAAKDQLSRTEVKAPEDGVVTDLRIHTPGGVIGASAPLMDLMPRRDRLIVTARAVDVRIRSRSVSLA